MTLILEIALGIVLGGISLLLLIKYWIDITDFFAIYWKILVVFFLLLIIAGISFIFPETGQVIGGWAIILGAVYWLHKKYPNGPWYKANKKDVENK